MSAISPIPVGLPPVAEHADTVWRRVWQSRRVLIGGGLLLAILVLCVGSLPWTLSAGGGLHYDDQDASRAREAPAPELSAMALGTDGLGRPLVGRVLLGGAISLGIGVAAAGLSVVLGVGVGMLAGYRGGWVDSLLMRAVDVLYGLPYILMIVLLKVALEPVLRPGFAWVRDAADWETLNPALAANLVVLFLAIGLVSWLTMARVVRGQVLSLRGQPFMESARASGLTEWRIFSRHLLPNLLGPILVYATLIIPQAILQESFLSFLGIGIQPPLPTWGSLAAEGLLPALNTVRSLWWLLVVPSVFLGVTLLSLNFLGDGLRDVFDPRREQAKI
jgi:oligopeptide transport system permease protein